MLQNVIEYRALSLQSERQLIAARQEVEAADRQINMPLSRTYRGDLVIYPGAKLGNEGPESRIYPDLEVGTRNLLHGMVMKP